MMHSQETLAQHAPHNAEAADEYKVKTDSNPDQRQAWRVVIGMAVTVCILFGTTISAFGVFTPHITTTFQSSNEQTANIATAFIFSMTLAMPLAGWLLDRVGPRLVMTLGTLLMGSGYLFASVSQDINSLILALALSGLGVGASTYIPATALVMRWVELKRQALALGVLVSGISMGTIIFPMLLTYITELYDWRFAMQLIAALAFLVCVPLLLWLARLPCQPLPGSEEHCNMVELTGQTVKQALRLPRYWLWVAMQVLLTFSTLGIVINIIPYLISAGYTPQQAATLFAIKSVAAFSGSFIVGLLCSRWDIKPILMVCTAIGSFGVLALLMVKDPTFGFSAVVFFSIAWGATFNLVNQLSPMLMEESVGQRNFGTLLGIGNLIAGVGSAFSPKLVGYLLDSSGSYTLGLLFCAACAIAALVPIALLPRRTPASTAD